jgi:hypothetical protein
MTRRGWRVTETATKAGVQFAVILICVASFNLTRIEPARASASKRPACWQQLLNAWYVASFTTIYPQRCYREALQHMPRDVALYTTAKHDLVAAEVAARHRKLPKHIDVSRSSTDGVV